MKEEEVGETRNKKEVWEMERKGRKKRVRKMVGWKGKGTRMGGCPPSFFQAVVT